MAQVQHSAPRMAYRRYEWVRYIILLGLFISIFFIANTIRLYIQKESRQFQEEVLNQVEAMFNVRIQYASISPTFWGWFHINGVEVKGKGMEVTAQRLTVHFDAIGMILGKRDITLITKIDLNRVSADIEQFDNPEEEKMVKEEEPSLSLEESFGLLSGSVFNFLLEGMDIPELNLELSLRNVNVTYRAPWGRFDMRNLLFTIEPTASNYEFELVATPELALGEDFNIVLPLRIAGHLDRDLLAGDLRFDVQNPYRNILNVDEQGLRVQWRDGVLEVRKNVDILPIDYGVRIDAVERSIHIGFNAYQFTPSDFISNSSASASSSLIKYIDGVGSLLYYPEIGLIYYGLNTESHINIEDEHDIRFKADATGTRDQVNIRSLGLSYQEKSFIDFSGVIDWQTGFPDGKLKLFWQGDEDSWSSQIIFKDRKDFVQVQSDYIRFRDYNIGQIESIIYPMEQNFKTFLQFNPASQINSGQSALLLSGFFNMDRQEAEVTLDLDEFEFLSLSEAGLIPSFIQSWKTNAQIYFDWSQGEFSFFIRDLEAKKDDDHRINLSATGDKSELEIQNLSLFWSNYFLKLRLTSEMSATPQFFGEVTSAMSEYSFVGAWDGTQAVISNDYGEISWNVATALGQLLIEDMPLMSIVNPPLLNAKVNVTLDPSWRVDVDYIKVDGEELVLQVDRGYVNSEGGTFNRIRYRDRFADLRGSLQYRHIGDNHSVNFSAVSDDLPINREVHTIELQYDGQEVSGQVSLQRFPLARLHVPTLEGTLNAQIDILELINSQDVRVKVNIARGFYQDNVVRMDMAGQYSPLGLNIYQLSAQYGENLLQGATTFADLERGQFAFAGQYSQVNRNIQQGFALKLRSEQEELESIGSMFSEPWRLDITLEPLRLNDRVMLSGSQMLLRYESNLYTLIGLGSLNLAAEYDVDSQLGYFNWRSSRGVLIDSVFNFNEENFLISISDIVIPLGLFNPYFTKREGARVVGFESGRIFGNLEIGAGGVLTSGVLEFSQDSKISVAYLPKDVLSLGGAMLVFNDNELILKSMIGNRLEERVDMEVGSFTNRVILALEAKAKIGDPTFDYTARLSIRSKNRNRADKAGLSYEMSVGNLINLQGRLSGDISFEGDTAGARLSGDIYLVSLDGNFGALTLLMNDESIKRRRVPTARNPKPGFVIQSSPRDDIRYTPLVIRTGNNVNFYIPPVIELTTADQQELVLVMDIQNGAPVGQNILYLEGDLGIRRGEIRALNNTFRIRDDGFISFSEEYGFNPLLKISADFKTEDGHLITIHYEDQPIGSVFDFKLSSNTLTESEIMQYLGMRFMPKMVLDEAGGLSGTGTAGGSDSTDDSTAYDDAGKDTLKTVLEPIGGIAEQYISKQLERALRFVPFIDTVTIRTNVVSNLAMSRFDTNTETSSWIAGSSPPNSNPWEIFDQTSISFGFRATPVFTIEGTFGMARLAGEKAFFGEADVLYPNLGVNLQFDTPWFLVSWTFAPTLARQSIDQLFVSSVSIGFTKVFHFRDWNDLSQQFRNGSLG